MTSDGELLRRYSEEGSQAAFSELVSRHANFVHAFAMRRINGDSHMAADITQKVFITLAQNARTLARHTALIGWLYTSTRNAVLDELRAERRRTEREKEAMLMYEIDESPREYVDERLFSEVDKLSAKDRDAVMMRFFNEWSFSRIAETLVITEDSARMRVDRALGKLRVSLARKGVPSTTAALAATLGNNAGLGAPAALTAQITEAALAAGAVAAPAGVAGLIALLYEFKAMLGVTAAGVLILIGTAEYQAAKADLLSDSMADVLVERTELTARLQLLRSSENSAPTSIVIPLTLDAPLQSTTGSTAGTSGPAIQPQDYVAILKARLAAAPEMQIPELALLAERSWMLAAGGFPPTKEGAFPEAFRYLRDQARTRFAILGIAAIGKFAEENGGLLPKQLADLVPYFAEPVSPDLLARYAVIRQGMLSDVASTEAIIGEISGLANLDDSALSFGRTPQSVRLTSGSPFRLRVQWAVNLEMARSGGVKPMDAETLRAFFSTDELAAVQKQLDLIK